MVATFGAHGVTPATAAWGFPLMVAVGASSASVHPCPWAPPHCHLPLGDPLGAGSRFNTTWANPIGPTGAPQHLLLWLAQPWWPQEPAVLLCPPCPLVATHHHLGMVCPTGGTHQVQCHVGTPTRVQWGSPTPTAWGKPPMVATRASGAATPPCPPVATHCHFALVHPTGGSHQR